MSVSAFIFFNLGFFVLYSLQLPWIEEYKIMKDEKWPWVQRADGWKAKLLVSLMRVSFNFLVMTPLSLYVLSMALKHQINYALKVEDLPSAWTLAWQILFCVYVEDVGFSIAHRLLHTPFLYKHVHKLHH